MIAVPELTFQARKINNESFRVIEVWLIASLIYVATCALIAAGAPAASKRRFPNSEAAAMQSLSHRPRHLLRCPLLGGLALTIAMSAAAIAGGASSARCRTRADLWRPRRLVPVPGHRRLRPRHAGARPDPCELLHAGRLGVSPGPIEAGILALAVFCATHVGETLRGALIAIPPAPDRRRAGDRPHLPADARLCAAAAGDAPDRAELRQHRRRDRQGVVAPLGDRRRRASAHHPGDHRPHLQDDGVLRSCRRASTSSSISPSAPAAGGSSAASGRARSDAWTPILTITGPDQDFRAQPILRGVDFDVFPADVVSIIGASGSGKTTLLRCIDLLEEFEAGEIRLDGDELGYRPSAARGVRLPGRQLAMQR